MGKTCKRIVAMAMAIILSASLFMQWNGLAGMWEVKADDLIDASNFTISKTSSTIYYTGEPNTSYVTAVKYNGTTLTEDEDYTITYANNIDAGTATYTITGIGDYTGTKTGSFTINKRVITNSSITFTSNYDKYFSANGNYGRIPYTIVYNGKTLKYGTDFTTSAVLNTEYTNYWTLTLTFTGAGNFSSTTTKTLKVYKQDIAEMDIVRYTNTMIYTGSELTPGVYITDSYGNNLVKGTDYTIEYENNVEVGTGTMTITGINYFKGSVSYDFEIVEITENNQNLGMGSVSVIKDSFTYDGTPKIPNVTVTDWIGNVLTEGTDYELVCVKNIHYGSSSACAWAVALDDSGYYYITGRSYSIGRRDISEDTIVPYLAGTATYNWGEDVTGDFGTLLFYDEDVDRVLISSDLTSNAYTDIKVGSFTNKTEAGSTYVTITGFSSQSTCDFTGSNTVEFTIEPLDISDIAVVTLDQSSYDYDGSDVTPEPVVTVKKTTTNEWTTLELGTDYTLTYEDNDGNSSVGVVTVNFINNFTGSIDTEFAINTTSAKTNVKNATVTLASSSMTYTGSQLCPTVSSVKVGSTTLTANTDYTVSYGENINVGTGTVTIKGTGDNYTGSITVEFTITAKSISSATLTLSPSSYTYSGSACEPTVTVKDGSTTLTSGTDYTSVTYSSNTNAGTATVTVTGTGNYTGTASKTFTISAKSISGATVALSGSSFEYTGSGITPSVSSVTLSDGTTLSSSDYTVSYSNNTNVGTATVTVTGSGNYTGTATASFTIVAGKISFTTDSSLVVASIPDQAFANGDAITPSLTITYGSVTLTEGTDYTLAYSNNTEPGTATVTITGMGDYSGTRDVTFKITSISLTGATVVTYVTSYTYSGNENKPSVKSVTTTDGTTASSSYYTVSWTNNINAGTGTVTVTGDGTHYTGSASTTFTISALSISNGSLTLSASSATYTGSAITSITATAIKVSGTTYDIDSTFTSSYSDNTNAGTAYIYVTGSGNFTGTATGTFIIEAANIIALDADDVPDQEYTGSAITPSVTIAGLTEGTDYTLSYDYNTEVGQARISVTGKGNYKNTKYVYFNIVEKNISGATVALSSTSATYTGSEITPSVSSVTLSNGTVLGSSDYTVTSYSNNTNVGTATVTVTGTGNYTGTATGSFTITQANISSCTADYSKTLAYTGSQLKPSITLSYGGTTLVENTDYTVSYGTNTSVGTNVGTITVTAKSNSNFTGSATYYFSVTETTTSIAGGTVTIADVEYTGSSVTPTITVVVDGQTLSQGTDYTASYTNDGSIGTVSVTITGTGAYTGTLTGSFKITAASITGATVTLATTSYTYSGSANEPTVSSVKTTSGTTITDTSKLKISYSNNTDAGTATVTVTGDGTYYTGTATTTFTISSKSISSLTAKISGTYTYTGSEIVPTVTISGLTEGTDFTVVASNNVNASSSAKVTITGKGNYTGTLEKTFTISTASISDCTAVYSANAVWTGSQIKQTVQSVTLGDYTLISGTDYTVGYGTNVDAGTGTIYLYGTGNFAGTKTCTFTITKDKVDMSTQETTVTIENQTYTGEAITPTVSITCDGSTLVENVDYVVEYSNNTSVGTATVTITGIGAYEGTVTATFTIEAAAHTHSYSSSWTTDSSYHWHACSCGDKSSYGAHTFNNGVTSSGVKTYTCTTCGYTKTETVSTSTSGSTTQLTTSTASADTTTTTSITLAIGATFTSGDCNYKVTATDQVECTGTSSSSKKIKIADTVKGSDGKTYKVTSIAANAFKGSKTLTTVTIGANVETIGASAFANCKKLTTVTIGKGVKTIAKKAFFKCKSLKTIIIKSKKLKKVGKKAIKGIKKNAVIKAPKKKLKAYKKLFKKNTGFKKATMKIKKK